VTAVKHLEYIQNRADSIVIIFSLYFKEYEILVVKWRNSDTGDVSLKAIDLFCIGHSFYDWIVVIYHVFFVVAEIAGKNVGVMGNLGFDWIDLTF